MTSPTEEKKDIKKNTKKKSETMKKRISKSKVKSC